MVGIRRRHVIAAAQPSAKASISATATLNPQDHANRWLSLTGDGSTLQTYTLPAATGSGNVYKFRVNVENSGTYTFNCVGSDEFIGTIMGTDSSGETEASGWLALAGDDFVQITCGTVALGAIGTFVEMHDSVAGSWHVNGDACQSGDSEATLFST